MFLVFLLRKRGVGDGAGPLGWEGLAYACYLPVYNISALYEGPLLSEPIILTLRTGTFWKGFILVYSGVLPNIKKHLQALTNTLAVCCNGNIYPAYFY